MRDGITQAFGRLYEKGEIYTVRNRDIRIAAIKALALHRVLVVNCPFCRGEHAHNIYEPKFPVLRRPPCRHNRTYLIQPFGFDISDGGEYKTNKI